MIASILEKKRRRITLDRVLVTKEDKQILLTEPQDINQAIVDHYQNAAQGINGSFNLHSRWQRQYTPKDIIDSRWYDSVMAAPNDEEWDGIIQSLPNDKAAGLSKISNEMLKHVGPKMKKVIKRLIEICLSLNDIPQEWREAMIYPTPKPNHWECSLDNTRPITLLETLRKALVKLINARLSKIIVKRHILEGNNYASLPGGSTF